MKRALALIIALVCMLGVFGMTSFADEVPVGISGRQVSVDFAGICRQMTVIGSEGQEVLHKNDGERG